jgi:hypothetical protein
MLTSAALPETTPSPRGLGSAGHVERQAKKWSASQRLPTSTAATPCVASWTTCSSVAARSATALA